MSEMIKRAALAADAEMSRQVIAGHIYVEGTFDMALIVRATIEAMREPTEGMVSAVDNEELMAWECFRGDGTAWDVADAYTAMINAALK